MNLAEFSLLTFIGSLAAGFLGALTGLGGGFIIVPFLTLFFGVDIRYAIGASLVSVIATSSGAAAAYLREGYTNIRVAMFLEIATTLGAVCGALVAHRIPTAAIAVIFGFVLLHSAFLASRRRKPLSEADHPDRFAALLRLNSAYPKDGINKSYGVRKVPLGFFLMWLAGILSGLLGIGSGALKVLAMDQVMRMPFKVSTTTSNFMIGVTAAAGAGIYLNRGFIDPILAMPVMLGVLLGAFAGSRTLASAPPRLLRIVFAVVITILALEMIYQGVMGKLG
jgi:uncharacterized membrane protein YfcA